MCSQTTLPSLRLEVESYWVWISKRTLLAMTEAFFLLFLNFSSKFRNHDLKLLHDRCLSHPFQFIIRHHPMDARWTTNRWLCCRSSAGTGPATGRSHSSRARSLTMRRPECPPHYRFAFLAGMLKIRSRRQPFRLHSELPVTYLHDYCNVSNVSACLRDKHVNGYSVHVEDPTVPRLSAHIWPLGYQPYTTAAL
jgi:hypothetical protein